MTDNILRILILAGFFIFLGSIAVGTLFGILTMILAGHYFLAIPVIGITMMIVGFIILFWNYS